MVCLQGPQISLSFNHCLASMKEANLEYFHTFLIKSYDHLNFSDISDFFWAFPKSNKIATLGSQKFTFQRSGRFSFVSWPNVHLGVIRTQLFQTFKKSMSRKLDSENLKKPHQRRSLLKKTENAGNKYSNVTCCRDPKWCNST